MPLISLLLLPALLPYLGQSANVNVGIINGTMVTPHSRPYMVSLQINGSHHCGGFLVSDRYVMTAAHCLNKTFQITAVLGAHNLSNSPNSIRMEVECYHPHPKFDKNTGDFDIMLLKLRGTVKRSKTVNWICIPKKDRNIASKSVCRVAGWGTTESSKNGEHLLEAQSIIQDQSSCINDWKKLHSLRITSRMVCALHPGGACHGDSGGPLVCNNIAVGIVSFGDSRNCNTPHAPNVYAKISAFLFWIKSILKYA